MCTKSMICCLPYYITCTETQRVDQWIPHGCLSLILEGKGNVSPVQTARLIWSLHVRRIQAFDRILHFL